MGVLSELKKGRGLLDENALTVSGMTLGEEISLSKNYNHEVIRPFDEPYSPTGGLMILRGNLAPDGAVVKRSRRSRRCSFTKALPTCSTARTRPSPPSTPVRSSRATWWSSAMRARRAARACAKCSADQRHLRHGGRQGSGAHHRRPLLRRDPRRGHRPCFARGCERRHDRPHRGGATSSPSTSQTESSN